MKSFQRYKGNINRKFSYYWNQPENSNDKYGG